MVDVQKQPETPTKPAVTNPSAVSFRPQSISISKPKQVEKNIDQDKVKEVEPVFNLNKQFTDDDFLKAWNNFQQTLSDEKRVGFKNLNFPVRLGDTTFEVVVNNVMQESEAKKLLSEAVQYIRTAIGNSSIVISIKIAEESEMQRSLSPEQRYLEMVAKNPQLEQFRKMLSLEID